MRDPIAPTLPKWPFYLGDALLLGLAYFIYHQNRPGHWELGLAVLCVALGALLAVTPFILEYRAALKLAESTALTTAVTQMENLETLAAQIGGATSRWQEVQGQADKTAAGARELADRMAGEVRAFTEFMQRANDGEKATLRLEVEKLRRAEGDWLQVLVRVLDHTFAVHQGALRSGQPNVIAQLTHFQNVCHDAARRVGLVPIAAAPSDQFDAQRHQPIEDGIKPAPGATVTETIAPGYSFQGKLIRPVLVRLGGQAEAETREASAEAPAADQNQLALEQPGPVQ
jgi:molecular chaperone GrpE (heat shock protein)